MSRTRVVLVTGCANGIGQLLAETLLARGEQVVATDVDLERLTDYAREKRWPEERCLLLKLDVTQPAHWSDAIEKTIQRFGTLDLVINNAGYLKPGWAVDTAPEEIHRHFDINTKGVIFGTQAAAREMLRRRSGHIVNIASTAALAPIPGLSAYSASKYAVRAYSLATALELEPHGVSVKTFCPDAVQTRMLDLQKSREEAALTFSGSRALTREQVVEYLLGPVLSKRPMEAWLPKSRGILARIADLFPELGKTAGASLRKKGLMKQARLRQTSNSSEETAP